jgi:hypothetical protein
MGDAGGGAGYIRAPETIARAVRVHWLTNASKCLRGAYRENG